MADTVTIKKRAVFVAAFADEDDRSISIEDPRDGITPADLRVVESAATGVLIGDKYGAAFTRVKSAKYITHTTRNYDIKSA